MAKNRRKYEISKQANEISEKNIYEKHQAIVADGASWRHRSIGSIGKTSGQKRKPNDINENYWNIKMKWSTKQMTNENVENSKYEKTGETW